jgi:hypothetical protein
MRATAFLLIENNTIKDWTIYPHGVNHPCSLCIILKTGENSIKIRPQRGNYSILDNVIQTEARPSGEIWLRMRNMYKKKPDVSTALDMTKGL